MTDTKPMTIEQRVEEFFDGILDDYIDYHDDSLLGRAGMAYLQKAVELKDVVKEFRRHLTAHEEQVRQEEREKFNEVLGRTGYVYHSDRVWKKEAADAIEKD